MKKLVALTLVFGLVAMVSTGVAEIITIELSGTITYVDDYDGLLGGQVQVGAPLSAVYQYDSTTADSNTSSTVGDYRHSTSPFGITATAGGLTWQTDPDNVNFLVEVTNNHSGASGDYYLLRSYRNLLPDGNPPGGFNPDALHISWQLDPGGEPYSSDALPLEPPDLSQFNQVFGFAVSYDDYETGERYFIRGMIDSAAFANPVPEPATLGLVALGMLGLLARRK